jgi:hypothetical protein
MFVYVVCYLMRMKVWNSHWQWPKDQVFFHVYKDGITSFQSMRKNWTIAPYASVKRSVEYAIVLSTLSSLVLG